MQTKSPRIGDAYNVFMLDNQSRRLAASTLDFYQYTLPPFVTWCVDHDALTLADITPNTIRTYLVHLQDRDLAANTLHGAARAIRRFLNFCVREELLDASPMAKVAMPRKDKRILPALSKDDVRKLLNACTSERDRAVVLFLLDTGARASECVRLNAGDIDARQGTVKIRQGKGRKDRMVYLGAKARKQLLRSYMEREQPGDNDPVWVNDKTGKRLTPSGLRQLLRRLGKRAGVKKCTPHTFRRTFALWSLRSGMSVYHLQRLMGHEDITVLLQYLELTEADIAAAHAEHGAVDQFLR